VDAPTNPPQRAFFPIDFNAFTGHVGLAFLFTHKTSHEPHAPIYHCCREQSAAQCASCRRPPTTDTAVRRHTRARNSTTDFSSSLPWRRTTISRPWPLSWTIRAQVRILNTLPGSGAAGVPITITIIIIIIRVAADMPAFRYEDQVGPGHRHSRQHRELLPGSPICCLLKPYGSCLSEDSRRQSRLHIHVSRAGECCIVAKAEACLTMPTADTELRTGDIAPPAYEPFGRHRTACR
jgi:hypothetical protein